MDSPLCLGYCPQGLELDVCQKSVERMSLDDGGLESLSTETLGERLPATAPVPPLASSRRFTVLRSDVVSLRFRFSQRLEDKLRVAIAVRRLELVTSVCYRTTKHQRAVERLAAIT